MKQKLELILRRNPPIDKKSGTIETEAKEVQDSRIHDIIMYIENDIYKAEYNPVAKEIRIQQKGTHRATMEKIINIQLKAAEYLCNNQKKYLETRNPFDLKVITQEEVASYLGCNQSNVSRNINGLTLDLPNEKSIRVSELIVSRPGLDRRKAAYVLTELQSDPKIFSGEKYIVPDQVLVGMLKKRHVELNRRGVCEIRKMLGYGKRTRA